MNIATGELRRRGSIGDALAMPAGSVYADGAGKRGGGTMGKPSPSGNRRSMTNGPITNRGTRRDERPRSRAGRRVRFAGSDLTGGQIVDLFTAGLSEIRQVEEAYDLDFDEWFDRGSTDDSKENVRRALLDGPRVRGFAPDLREDGSIRIEGIRAIVRGVKPVTPSA